MAGTGEGKTEAALAAAWEECFILFVYPTKFLAKDQRKRFKGYGIEVVIADGDHRIGGIRSIVPRSSSRTLMLRYHARKDREFWDYVASEVGAIVWGEVHYYDPRRANQLLGLVKALRRAPYPHVGHRWATSSAWPVRWRR